MSAPAPEQAAPAAKEKKVRAKKDDGTFVARVVIRRTVTTEEVYEVEAVETFFGWTDAEYRDYVEKAQRAFGAFRAERATSITPLPGPGDFSVIRVEKKEDPK